VCEHVAGATRASYADLRAGLKAETPFVVIRHAPIGMVEYRANDSVLQSAACEADLVLGPLSPGAVVSVSETKVTALFWIRVVDVLLILLIAWRLLVPSPERLRPAT
jgi:hypothetical protein